MYDITRGAIFVNPDDCEQNEWVQAMKAKSDPRTFEKVLRTMDKANDDEVRDSQQKCRISWTKTGAAVGFRSSQPARDVNHAWDAVTAVMGTTGRPPVFTMGALFKWRISLRQEQHWLMKKEETGAFDPLTGEPIVAAEYFISDTFVPPRAEKKTKRQEREPESLGPMAYAMKRAMEKRANA
jgi:hypothetical protein